MGLVENDRNRQRLADFACLDVALIDRLKNAGILQ